MAFDAQVTDLVGGTIDQTACDQWAVDGAREIIAQLPSSLQERCSDFAVLDDSPTTLDLDTAANAKVGKVLYCTRYSGTRYLPCRVVAAQYATLTDDSTASNYYATNDDPAYFISDNTVVIKPDTDATYIGRVYHVVYPTSLDISAITTGQMTIFPIECEHLMVLYVAMKQLQQYMAIMSTSWNSAITQALTNASDVINNNQPSTTTDAYGALSNEDIEIMSASLQLASQQLQDAGGRLQQDSTKYQWYSDQYTRLSADYIRGITALQGV